MPKTNHQYICENYPVLKRIAIFASGEGTNAENIIRYFQHHNVIEATIVLCDNKNAGVINRARNLSIPVRLFTYHEFYETDEIMNLMKTLKIDFIVLAGFLKLIPDKLIKEYNRRIVNIHPALLPKFGGKGMYGIKVHKAVYDSQENETGITIHHVNENFDEGEIIFQKKIQIDENDSPEIIMQKVRELEVEFYPKVIEKMLS